MCISTVYVYIYISTCIWGFPSSWPPELSLPGTGGSSQCSLENMGVRGDEAVM